MEELMRCPYCGSTDMIEDGSWIRRCNYCKKTLTFKNINPAKMLDDLQHMIHQTAKDKGWWDEPREAGTCIALMHSELSEALEALRQGNPDDEHCPAFSSVEVELSDAIIRILDFAEYHNYDIAGAMFAKMEYNTTRDHKHGKEF